MREKIIIGLAIFAGALLAWNMNTIFTGLPDELNQGAIYRIIYFHVPANILGMLGFGLGMVLSIGYLVTKDLRYDALAASVTEVSLVFASIGLATGSIWARIIWGVWWAWDVRLTSWLVCWLIFGGYLMLRRADRRTEPARPLRGRGQRSGQRQRLHLLHVHRVVEHAAPAAGAVASATAAAWRPAWKRPSTGTCWRWPASPPSW